MSYQENRKSESDVLHYQFTAFLDVALRRRRKDYILSQKIRAEKEAAAMHVEPVQDMESCDDFWKNLPTMETLESGALVNALVALKERERFILLERVVNGAGFEVLAAKTGLTYQGTASVYYRAIKKVKKIMEESNGI